MSNIIKYFSYGHNTNLAQFKKRIPNAKLLGTAMLWGYRFELKHFANIDKDANSSVQGVLYSMPKFDFHLLDKDEDYHIHYNRTMVTVDISGDRVHALTYIMTPKYHNSQLSIHKELPTVKYVKWIAQGYRENHIGLSQLISALEDRIKEEKFNYDYTHSSTRK